MEDVSDPYCCADVFSDAACSHKFSFIYSAQFSSGENERIMFKKCVLFFSKGLFSVQDERICSCKIVTFIVQRHITVSSNSG